MGQTALHLAVKNGNLQIFKCNICRETEQSIVLFIHCVLTLKILLLNLNKSFLSENEKCVKVLIQNGATINIKDKSGDEPLQSAVNTGIILYICKKIRVVNSLFSFTYFKKIIKISSIYCWNRVVKAEKIYCFQQ